MQKQGLEIHHWLLARQELLASLTELCELRPFKASSEADISNRLDTFCQLLIDYVAFGHFKAFESMVPHGTIKAQDQLLGALNQSMIKFLDFNDRYQAHWIQTDLETDLSVLAQDLATRFDWEDALLQLSKALDLAPQAMAKSA